MTFTASLLALLRCFDSSRGLISIAAHTDSGFGVAAAVLRPPFSEIPARLLDLLLDDYELRVRVAPNGSSVDLPCAIAVWRPTIDFSRATGWQPRPRPEAVVQIAAALATMPPPSFAVDGGHEVVAAWRLERPIRDQAAAMDLSSRLAARLGATAPQNLPTCTFPIAGVRRNWAARPAEYHEILTADPTRLYTPQEIGIDNETRATPRDSAATGRQRRNRAPVRA